MDGLNLLKICEHRQLASRAAKWFAGKWRVPEAAYLESMSASAPGCAVPQWYLVVKGDDIVAGLGVIENDFHDRADLRPNVCALYVEEDFRNRGVAGKMLRHVCEDMQTLGVDTLYLLTDHTGFYERYGWEYHCTAMGQGDSSPSRVYVHKMV